MADLTNDQIEAAVQQAVGKALRSEAFHETLRQSIAQASILAVNSRLFELSVESESVDEAVKEYMANQAFITNTRKRCEKIIDKMWGSMTITITAAVIGALYLVAQYLIPKLPHLPGVGG